MYFKVIEEAENIYIKGTRKEVLKRVNGKHSCISTLYEIIKIYGFFRSTFKHNSEYIDKKELLERIDKDMYDCIILSDELEEKNIIMKKILIKI